MQNKEQKGQREMRAIVGLRLKSVFSARIPESPKVKSKLQSSIIVEDKQENTTLHPQKRQT